MIKEFLIATVLSSSLLATATPKVTQPNGSESKTKAVVNEKDGQAKSESVAKNGKSKAKSTAEMGSEVNSESVDAVAKSEDATLPKVDESKMDTTLDILDKDFTLTAEESEAIRELGLRQVSRKDWSFTLGATFRKIDGIEYHGVSSGSGQYYNGSYDPSTGDLVLDDDAAQTTPTPGAPVFAPGSVFASLSSLNFAGSDDDADANGVILGVSHLLSQHDTGYYSLDFTLVSLFVDESMGLGGSSTTDVFLGNPNPGGGYNSPSGPIGGGGHPAALPGATPVGFDIDMAAFTFGVGASQHFVWDSGLTLDFGAGPTLTIVDFDFDGPSVMADGSIGENSSGDVDFLFGVYAGINVGYEINESWAISGGIRYDLIQELKDDVADVDLSGLSFEIKGIYSF
jgi:hypothetical protein